MKRDRRSTPNPEVVGTEVRKLVQRSLERQNFTPFMPGFLERVEKLAVVLALWGARMNLTAGSDDPNELAFHVVDSLMPLVLRHRPDAALLQNTFSAADHVLDLGSGAGFPGLVLAAASKAEFTLCESRRKRASFLSIAVAEMELDNATVSAIRAEPANFDANFDALTARAVGDLPSLYRIAAAALRPGGIAILYASSTQRIDLKDAHEAGLTDYARIGYQIERGSEKLTHTLAIWRKQ